MHAFRRDELEDALWKANLVRNIASAQAESPPPTTTRGLTHGRLARAPYANSTGGDTITPVSALHQGRLNA